ncbi:DUF6597 domain-containing transcriptional factor [Paenibacillus chartarius]|uniref:DUF6597 domain-containing transcriptional factor n=1 Tax=Paenibacillus chartarius TaxID=747481 RepID=A0ABV6DR82_9BACL
MHASSPMPSMGVLKLAGSGDRFQLSRVAPSPEAGRFVLHYWIVRWNIPEPFTHRQEVVPNPCVNLVVEPGRTLIYGAAKAKYAKELTGQGCVFGVKFRPGGFYPFFGKPMDSLAERPIPVSNVFPAAGAALEADLLTMNDDNRMAAYMENIIVQRLPKPDDNVELIHQIIEQVKADHGLTKVDELCERFFIHKRKLQRLFEQYVGVSPKWIIRLYRLQNAAELIDRGETHDWLRLSMDLGYHDQAHFIKEFKAVIGKTPEEYMRQPAGGQASHA